MKTRTLFAAALIAAASGLPAAADDAPAHPTLAIGAAAPDFDLPGVDGRTHSLKEYASARVLVIVFTCNHCPTAQAYEERLQKLSDDFAPKGATLVAISPNDPKAVRLDELGYTDLSDSLEEMKIRARERHFTFPYLYDGETQAVAHLYGPTATPHVFVFDGERKLRFAGRVDDGENPAKITVSDARNAIGAVLAGQPVPVEKTKVFGCSIKWAEKKSWLAEGEKKWAQEEVALTPIDAAGLKALTANDSGKLRVVNVWATWCGPCQVEFPDLIAVYRMYRGRGLELATVSADPPEKSAPVLAFLKEQRASGRNHIFAEPDPYALIDPVDPKWQGELPHTVVVAPGGRVIYRSDGAFDPLALRKAIVGYYGRYYHSVAGQ
ncbi:MAG TPA: redoxin domain-containing protein [Vicinamibacteria bacterium]|nr:redoxin domain-containing protein [Vicinamibacteria bacterium]